VFVPVLDWALISFAAAAYGNGGIGAAFATRLTEIFFLVCILRALPAGTFDTTSRRVALRAVAVGGLQGIVLLALRASGVPWILAAVVAAVLYLAAVVRLRLVPRDVTTWLKEVLRRREGAPARPAGSTPSPAEDVEAA